MNIKEIQIDKFPVVIITDSHTNLININKVKELYPNSQIICLGDITFLFAKEGEIWNEKSIQYFIDNDIPCLEGNHEQHILACYLEDCGENLYDWHILPKFDGHSTLAGKYNLSKEHVQYLKTLPRGFKLNLPNGKNYYAFHNEPFNLWNFPDKIDSKYFKEKYVFDSDTIGVLQGHLHLEQIDNFTPKRYCVGRLSKDGKYALITKKGVEFREI